MSQNEINSIKNEVRMREPRRLISIFFYIFSFILGCVVVGIFFTLFNKHEINSSSHHESQILPDTIEPSIALVDINNKLLPKYETVDVLSHQGVTYTLLTHTTEWSSNQIEQGVSRSLVQGYSLLSATRQETLETLWITPIDSGLATISLTTGGDLLITTTGNSNSLMVIDIGTGAVEQRIQLDLLRIGQCNYFTDRPDWVNFFGSTRSADSSELYFFAYLESEEQNPEFTTTEVDYYIVRYDLAATIDEWLSNPCETQWTLGPDFTWGVKVDRNYDLLLDEESDTLIAFERPTEYPDYLKYPNTQGMVLETQEYNFLKINATTGDILNSTTVNISPQMLNYIEIDNGNPVIYNLDGSESLVLF